MKKGEFPEINISWQNVIKGHTERRSNFNFEPSGNGAFTRAYILLLHYFPMNIEHCADVASKLS